MPSSTNMNPEQCPWPAKSVHAPTSRIPDQPSSATAHLSGPVLFASVGKQWSKSWHSCRGSLWPERPVTSSEWKSSCCFSGYPWLCLGLCPCMIECGHKNVPLSKANSGICMMGLPSQYLQIAIECVGVQPRFLNRQKNTVWKETSAFQECVRVCVWGDGYCFKKYYSSFKHSSN